MDQVSDNTSLNQLNLHVFIPRESPYTFKTSLSFSFCLCFVYVCYRQREDRQTLCDVVGQSAEREHETWEDFTADVYREIESQGPYPLECCLPHYLGYLTAAS